MKKAIIIFLIFISWAVVSQTSNIGELTIVEGTVLSIVDEFDNKDTGDIVNNGDVYLYSSLINDGMFRYSKNNGNITRFLGDVKQEIQGGGSLEFYDLLLDNSSSYPAFELRTSMSIFNKLYLEQGILQSRDLGGSVLFQDDANHEQASSSSYIDGLVSKKGNTEFEFPVGSGEHYRSVKISSPSLVSDVFSVVYHQENSNYNGYSHSSVSSSDILFIDNTEYWEINREEGNSEIELTLSINSGSSSEALVDALSGSVHIVGWSSADSEWKDLGANIGLNDDDLITKESTLGFSIFALALMKTEEVPLDGIVIYNAITPNGDGKNDFFLIEGLENYIDNTLKVFNRWGVTVYEEGNYGEEGKVFRGKSGGRATIGGGNLPRGVYFYMLKCKSKATGKYIENKTGDLYINN